ncbi:MAG: hypothetical protein OQL28_08535 [Sedimenticola sp.]|nr:hypothetical protein [Sedimenticola sp.]
MPARMSLTVANQGGPVISPLPVAQNDTTADPDKAAVQIPDSCWEPVDFLEGSDSGTPSQLLATLYVNACPMHFEAYLVDGEGEVVDPKHQQAIRLVKSALRDDEAWTTFRYGDNEYVMIAIPFGICR